MATHKCTATAVELENQALRQQIEAIRQQIEAVREKNEAMRQQNEALRQREEALRQRKDELQALNEATRQRNEALRHRNDELQALHEAAKKRMMQVLARARRSALVTERHFLSRLVSDEELAICDDMNLSLAQAIASDRVPSVTMATFQAFCQERFAEPASRILFVLQDIAKAPAEFERDYQLRVMEYVKLLVVWATALRKELPYSKRS